MTKIYVKIKDGIVVQKQPNKETGFIEADNSVIPGYLYDSKTKKFSPPAIVYDFYEEMKKIRDIKINGGITVSGIELATDDVTQSRIMAARIMAKENSSYTVNWKTPAGFVPLDAPTIISLSDAIHDHVQACFTAEANTDISKISDIEGLQSAYDAEYIKAISA